MLRRRKPIRRRSVSRSGITPVQHDELKVLFKDVVMLRAGAFLFEEGKRRSWMGNCQHCEKQRWLQVSHIEPQGRCPHLKYDVMNAVALCMPCHLYWWHKAPREAEEWITAFLGVEVRAALAMRAKTKGVKQDYWLLKFYLLQQRSSLRKGTP